jgi:pyruvate carboxylase
VLITGASKGLGKAAAIAFEKEGARLALAARSDDKLEELKNSFDIPIHLHTHDTSGAGVAMQIEAARAGCHIIDGAVSSMSGLTSQPSLNALVAATQTEEFAPDVQIEVLDRLGRYWEEVRSNYQVFDPGIKSTSTDVYSHEIPGGQYSNLFNQAMKVGLSSDEFYQLTQRYTEVNQMFGNIVKVTPSSKVVGDMALMLQKQGLTGEEFLKEKPSLDYPDSVISFFRGHMGEPFGGFPEDVRELVLGKNAPAPEAPKVNSADSLKSVKADLETKLGREVSNADAISSRLYPKVFQEFQNHLELYGDTGTLSSSVFFYGLKHSEEIEIDLEPGKTLIISLQGISEPDVQGIRKVFFSLNGFERHIEIQDLSAASNKKTKPKAEKNNPQHVGASMPAKILEIKVSVGDKVKAGDVLLITEAMKMEYAVSAKIPGVIKSVLVVTGEEAEDGDLLIEISQ